MALLVMLAALGAVNAMTLVGARVYASLGADHALFATLARTHAQSGAPVRALAAQAAVCLAMIAVAGTQAGLAAVNAGLAALGLETVATLGQGGFDVLLKCTAPVFWGFFLLSGVSLFVLRVREPARPRPFRVPLYPLLPLVFCATCAAMLRSAIEYAGALGLLGLVPVALGLPLYFLSRRSA
jgi:amino acid transporter